MHEKTGAVRKVSRTLGEIVGLSPEVAENETFHPNRFLQSNEPSVKLRAKIPGTYASFYFTPR